MSTSGRARYPPGYLEKLNELKEESNPLRVSQLRAKFYPSYFLANFFYVIAAIG